MSYEDQCRAEWTWRKRKKKQNKHFNDWLEHVSPQYDWQAKHLALIQNQLKRIIDGENLKLMILMPPRHGKTLLTTIHFSAYFLEKFPDKKIIVAGYNQDYAYDFSREIRKLAVTRIQLSQERNAVSNWETAIGGSLRAISMNAGATGKGAHLFIIDDPIRGVEDANRQTFREKIGRIYLRDLRTRTQPEGTSFILIQTNWHYDDLGKRIVKSYEGKDWIVLKLSALAEENDILGRKIGDALWPEKYSREYLLALQKDDPEGFAALYQQNAVIEGGNIIKRDWWRYYKDAPNFDYVIQSIDTAWETKKSNDYSVCTTWGISGKNIYLINMWRDKLNYPDLKRAIISLAEKYKPMYQYIENTASGKAAIQELSRDTYIPIKPIKPEGSKEVRARAISNVIENGKVFIPESFLGQLDFLDELSSFPKGIHDDIVDSVTMAIAQIINLDQDIPKFTIL